MDSQGALNVDLAIGYDYSQPNFQGTQTSTADGAEWDIAEWNTAEWAGNVSRVVNFVTGGIGTFVSTQVSLLISGQTITWYQITYNYDIAQTY